MKGYGKNCGPENINRGKRMWKTKTGLLLTLVCLSITTFAQVPDSKKHPPVNIQEGKGSFTFLARRGDNEIPIPVFYYQPADFGKTSPVLVVVPGAGRDGDEYRDAWIGPSDKYGVLVLSPMYPDPPFKFADYHMGGVIKNLELRNVQIQEHPSVYRIKDEDILYDINRNRDEWLFADFDRIFEVAVETTGSTQAQYDMFGHSAGGQILHRYVIFHPGSKANRILASNSGFYTLPSFDVALPLGIKDTGLTDAGLAGTFNEKLVLFLGELDNENETRGTHLRTPVADSHGIGRYARGRYFLKESKKIAESLGADFNWSLEVVPGVGHDFRKMSTAAAVYLYETR